MAASKQHASDKPIGIIIPKWVKRIPILHRMYWNPVFQRRIIRNLLDIDISNKAAFITGLAISLVMSSLTSVDLKIRTYIIVGFICIGVLTIILRMLGTALIATAKGTIDILSEERKDPVLSTPQRSSSIYFGLCIGTLMRGHRVVEVAVSFMTGIVAFFIVMWLLASLSFSDTGRPDMLTFSWVYRLTLFAFGAFALTVTALMLFTFASALYATFLDLLTSMIISIVYTIAVVAFGAFFLFVPFMLRDISDMEESEIMAGMGFGALFLICWLLMMIYSTAWAGLVSFSRRRCPGYYEDDKTTAADHVLRGIR